MTTEHEATRTLVKSPPELWAECSDSGSLARHLGEFGEIRITRLEPESAVAWEGEHASGTVRIEPSGWGTRVTLTAQTRAEAPEAPSPLEKLVQVEPVVTEPETLTEEEQSHAMVEETQEDSDPVPVADVGRARARWRRLTAKVRGVFGTAEAPDDPGASTEPAETAGSIPPPGPGLEPAEPAEAVEPIAQEPEAEPEPVPEPATETAPEVELDTEAVLTAALDSLGQAHHRPFSRA